jgi:hypothetical protein
MGRRSSSLRLPQYLMSAMFGVEMVVILIERK